MLIATRRLLPAFVLIACIGAAVARIVATYSVFNQTWDEPAHVAAGMQWIDRGTYTYEPLHPPLARVFTAIGPWLAGIRSGGHESVWLEGNAIFHAGHRYDRNLALARLGVLPFFVIATVVVFAWAGRLGGPPAAIGATLLFTTLPPVLASAGIATTDMAIAATIVLALFCTILWLERPTAGRGILLGVAMAAALLSKFSALLFLPAGVAAIAIVRWRAAGSGEEPSPRASKMRGLRLAYVAALVTVWAGYRFAVGPLTTAATPDDARTNASDPLSRLASAPVFPAPALFEGVGHLAVKNRAGHKSYLLGDVRDTGWWYFFPVALAVKTPLAFILLCAAGALAAARPPPGLDRRRQLEPLVIAIALLLVCIPSRITIGVRHVLPIYPFLAITAALGLARILRSGRGVPLAALCAALLLGWQLVSSARAHPDYLAYFNELAGSHPERVLVDSDLDSGQDLKRLADTLRARRIAAVWLAYAGSATVAEHGLPRVQWLQPHTPTRGWVAASLYALKLGSVDRPGHDDFAWLERYTPVASVGKSIWLYYIP
jgi:hypothetical protein